MSETKDRLRSCLHNPYEDVSETGRGNLSGGRSRVGEIDRIKMLVRSRRDDADAEVGKTGMEDGGRGRKEWLRGVAINRC